MNVCPPARKADGVADPNVDTSKGDFPSSSSRTAHELPNGPSAHAPWPSGRGLNANHRLHIGRNSGSCSETYKIHLLYFDCHRAR